MIGKIITAGLCLPDEFCGLIDSGLYVEAFSELDYTSAMGPGMGMIRNGKDQNSNCR